MAEEQPIPPDPIRTKSLSGPIAFSTLLLIVSTAWAIWDEAVHKRPYLDMQDKWITKFGAYLDSIEGGVKEREVQINNSPEYQAAKAIRQKYAEAEMVIVEGYDG